MTPEIISLISLVVLTFSMGCITGLYIAHRIEMKQHYERRAIRAAAECRKNYLEKKNG